MIVIDRAIVNLSLSDRDFGDDPLWDTLCEFDLSGCYVTDSEDWIPHRVYHRLFIAGTSHFDDEILHVGPSTVITIGRKSKSYVARHLRAWTGTRPITINVLQYTRNPRDTARLRTQLINELRAKYEAGRKRLESVEQYQAIVD